MLAEVSFGEWLQRRRKALGLTQDQLARQINCSTSALRKMEEGLRRPSEQMVEQLAQVFKIAAYERTSFLRFARGKLEAAAPEVVEDTPWRTTTKFPRTNLPAATTSFIGREKELKEVADLLLKSRLVTLTGSGGVGKTRLAIQVVADALDKFPDGVWILDLAPLTNPVLVAYTLASLLGLRESGDKKLSITDLLINYFHSRTALIIFDNCEHLIESCAQLVHMLLTSCVNVSILATSREAMRVSGEIPYRVPSLQIPKPEIEFAIDKLSNMESVKLFTERASAVNPSFAISPQNVFIFSQICRRLDGIPLAIELAAARANVLSVEQILERLEDCLTLLTHGLRNALPRHQTLRATIEWSHNLLSEKERVLFRQLAVFSGGWTLEAAEEVCGVNGIESGEVLDLLSQLVDKSLVLVETLEGKGWYRWLETIRQFAREKLSESGETVQVRERHLACFLGLAERAEKGLSSTGRKTWLERLEIEHDNFRTALAWSLDQDSPRLEAGLQLACKLFEFWYYRGYVNEGREWLERALLQITFTNAQIAIPTRAKAHYALGTFFWSLPDYEHVQAHAETSLKLYQELEDLRGIALTLGLLGRNARAQRDYATAIARFEQSLALSRNLGDNQGICNQLVALAFVWWRYGEYSRAEDLLEEGLALSREIGDTTSMADAKFGLAVVARAQGKYEQADVLCHEMLREAEELGEKSNTASILRELGILSLRQGNYMWAREHLEASLILAREMGEQRSIAATLSFLGDIALSQSDIAGARSLFQQMATISEVLGDKLYALRARRNLAKLAFTIGDDAAAQVLYKELLTQFQEINSKVDVADTLLALGNIERVHFNPDTALDYYRESLRIRYALLNPHDIAATLEQIAALATNEGQCARAAHLLGAAAQMREHVGAPLSSYENIEYDKTIGALTTALGDLGYKEVFETGKTLSIEQAVKIALDQPE